MWTSARFQEYLQQHGRGSLWSSLIYPSMKRAIANTMKVAQEHVEARRNSFELYGADFVLGRDFRPWLIEINSSPTMHASTPVTAQLCAQVLEDTIKVVLDRRADRSCDVGSFELLWRQVRGAGPGGWREPQPCPAVPPTSGPTEHLVQAEHRAPAQGLTQPNRPPPPSLAPSALHPPPRCPTWLAAGPSGLSAPLGTAVSSCSGRALCPTPTFRLFPGPAPQGACVRQGPGPRRPGCWPCAPASLGGTRGRPALLVWLMLLSEASGLARLAGEGSAPPSPQPRPPGPVRSPPWTRRPCTGPTSAWRASVCGGAASTQCPCPA